MALASSQRIRGLEPYFAPGSLDVTALPQTPFPYVPQVTSTSAHLSAPPAGPLLGPGMRLDTGSVR